MGSLNSAPMVVAKGVSTRLGAVARSRVASYVRRADISRMSSRNFFDVVFLSLNLVNLWETRG